MTRPRRACALAALFLLLLLAPIPPAEAQQRTPLLMEGKTSLYQRILTRPGAGLAAAPGEAAGTAVPPLSLFFVYDRKPAADGAEWLEIGPSGSGQTVGWIAGDLAIDWKQTLIVAFTNPVNRGRALFFDERESLLDLIESEQLLPTVEGWQAAVEGGGLPDGTPIVSVEPPTHVDLAENFYLLPILDYDYAYFESGFSSLALQVAAASLQTGGQPAEAAAPAVDPAAAMKAYRAGVVFVIDTTTSMGPYIDRTRQAVERLYGQLSGSPYGDRISFGLVAFRDNVEVAPGLDYVFRVYADLDDGLDRNTFMKEVAKVEPSAIPSRGFNEDAYAGVLAAIRDIDWTGFAGRYVVLITDAGARTGADPLGSTGRDTAEIRTLAQENGIAILALHLLTPEGRQTHEMATQQYTALTDWPNVGQLYFPVAAGAVDAFGERVDLLADLMVSQLAAAHAGGLAAAPAALPDDDVLAKAALVGRAMQLAWLGKTGGATVPPLFSAWVADRDLVDPAQKTLEVRVLITKNQISDLQATLRAIVEAGEASTLTPTDFFAQLQSAAAAMSRRPDQVASGDTRRLADLGLVGEYLEDLPYRSRIMELTEDDWLSWSFGQQREFLDEIESKINLYEDLHDDLDLWIALDDDRARGDAVYPMPLDALP